MPEFIIDPTIEAETSGGVCAVYSVACPNGLIYRGPEDRIVEKQIAAFGELGWKIVDKLKATFGLRVSKVDVDGTTGFGGAFSAVPLTPLITGEAKSSEKPVTPKAVLSYEPDRDNMFYLSAAKGYRAGGVNIPVGVTCDGDLIRFGLPVGADGHPHVPGGFSSDSLWSYEIGAKNTMFGRTLQINSSLFVIDRNKIQQNVYLPSCGEQFFANLGKVQSRGGDIDVTWKPIQPLTLDIKLAYTDARYTQASCAGVLAYTGIGLGCGSAGTVAPIVGQGDRLPGAPWSFLGSVEYAAPIAAFGDRVAYLRIDYQHTTAQSALIPGLDDRNALFDRLRAGPAGDARPVAARGHAVQRRRRLAVRDQSHEPAPADVLVARPQPRLLDGKSLRPERTEQHRQPVLQPRRPAADGRHHCDLPLLNPRPGEAPAPSPGQRRPAATPRRATAPREIARRRSLPLTALGPALRRESGRPGNCCAIASCAEQQFSSTSSSGRGCSPARRTQTMMLRANNATGAIAAARDDTTAFRHVFVRTPE